MAVGFGGGGAEVAFVLVEEDVAVGVDGRVADDVDGATVGALFVLSAPKVRRSASLKPVPAVFANNPRKRQET
jgi:hypothetical protein